MNGPEYLPTDNREFLPPPEVTSDPLLAELEHSEHQRMIRAETRKGVIQKRQERIDAIRIELAEVLHFLDEENRQCEIEEIERLQDYLGVVVGSHREGRLSDERVIFYTGLFGIGDRLRGVSLPLPESGLVDHDEALKAIKRYRTMRPGSPLLHFATVPFSFDSVDGAGRSHTERIRLLNCGRLEDHPKVLLHEKGDWNMLTTMLDLKFDDGRTAVEPWSDRLLTDHSEIERILTLWYYQTRGVPSDTLHFETGEFKRICTEVVRLQHLPFDFPVLQEMGSDCVRRLAIELRHPERAPTYYPILSDFLTLDPEKFQRSMRNLAAQLSDPDQQLSLVDAVVEAFDPAIRDKEPEAQRESARNVADYLEFERSPTIRQVS